MELKILVNTNGQNIFVQNWCVTNINILREYLIMQISDSVILSDLTSFPDDDKVVGL